MFELYQLQKFKNDSTDSSDSTWNVRKNMVKKMIFKCEEDRSSFNGTRAESISTTYHQNSI